MIYSGSLSTLWTVSKVDATLVELFIGFYTIFMWLETLHAIVGEAHAYP